MKHPLNKIAYCSVVGFRSLHHLIIIFSLSFAYFDVNVDVAAQNDMI